jgi:hypothetical protein
MPPRNKLEAVTVRPGDRLNHEVAVHVRAACGCLYVRSKRTDDRGSFRTLITLSKACLGTKLGTLREDHVFSKTVDWMVIATGLAIARNNARQRKGRR